MPPSRACPNSSLSPAASSMVPSSGTAPSATTTMEKFRPRACRRLPTPLRPVLALQRIRSRGPEDRSATGQDAARRLDRQLLVQVLEGSAPAVAEAHDRMAVEVDPLADDRADRRVQPRTVAA